MSIMLPLLVALLLTPARAEASRAGEVARELLASELGVAKEGIRIDSAVAAQWPDTSLGCPRKGMQYSPVVTKGHLVVLETGGRKYPVHVAGDKAVLCEKPADKPMISAAARLSQMARRDLAGRLQVPEDAVKTVRMQPRSWPDASLGCPRPATTYAQVETPGFVIELEAAGKAYRYHSDLGKVVPCDDLPQR